MDSPGSPTPSLVIDEQWFTQWVAFGMLDLAVYLTKYAAFQRYCEAREARAGRPSRRRRQSS